MSARRPPARRPATTRSTTTRSTDARKAANRKAATKQRARADRRAKLHDPARRIKVLGAVFVAIAVLYVGSLVDLQTLNSDRYVDFGQRQRTKTSDLAAYRGSIVDRGGFVLAASTPSTRVVADPTMIQSPVATAAVLAPALGVDEATLVDQLTPDSESDRYVELGKYLDEETVARVDVVKAESPRETMAGIFVQSEEQRVYPAGELAAPIVGGVDPDENGTFGIEYLYDEVMTGEAGSTTSEKGAGKYGTISVGDFEVDPASEGYDVVLTIDHRLQYVVEQALVEHCEETGGNWATAVGSDPRTGEILFMGTAAKNEDGTCSVPNYNASLIYAFEPGSVMKAVTVAAAVDQLGINRNTTYEVPRSLQVGDVKFTQAHDDPPAPYSLIDIIANSMNIGTMLMARDLGAESLYGYMKAFGIGEPTGIDFKGEATGTVRDWTEWYDSNMGSIPIGQGVTTNAVQILSAYNAIANDGLFVSPKLVSALMSPDGSEILTEPQTSDRAVSSETADEVTAMLEAVVDHGTGQAAAIPGYNVAGKTGTAWKVYDYGDGRSGYGEDGARRYTVTFAGFVPAENPQLSMVVVVDEPQTHTTASLVAAPLFHDIGLYALRILGIPPTDESAVETEGLIQAAPTPLPVTEEPPVDETAKDATDENATDEDATDEDADA